VWQRSARCFALVGILKRNDLRHACQPSPDIAILNAI
jgi:hypothetical protein